MMHPFPCWRFELLSESEIGNAHLAMLSDQEIVELEVTMKHATLVKARIALVQRPYGLHDVRKVFARRRFAAALTLDHVEQAALRHERRDEVRGLRRSVHFNARQDSWMRRQRPPELELEFKVFERTRLVGQVIPFDDPTGKAFARRLVSGQAHRGEATSADDFAKSVSGNAGVAQLEWCDRR